MERHEMLLKLRSLKLHGMAAAFDEVIDEGNKRSRTPFDVLARLLAAEDSERHARSIRYQMTAAKFPEYRELANFDFAESPVNEQQVRLLHDGGHSPEWAFDAPTTQAAQTIDVISSLGVDASDSYPVANMLREILAPHRARFENLMPFVKQWRDAVLR